MLLEIKNLDSGYGFLQVLWDVSFHVEEGEFIGLIGPNGAGKSTTLKTIAGLIQPKGGEILFGGESIGGMEGHKLCWKGIALISEELNLFPNMTVQENLEMGAFTVRDKQKEKENLTSISSSNYSGKFLLEEDNHSNQMYTYKELLLSVLDYSYRLISCPFLLLCLKQALT